MQGRKSQTIKFCVGERLCVRPNGERVVNYTLTNNHPV